MDDVENQKLCEWINDVSVQMERLKGNPDADRARDALRIILLLTMDLMEVINGQENDKKKQRVATGIKGFVEGWRTKTK